MPANVLPHVNGDTAAHLASHASLNHVKSFKEAWDAKCAEASPLTWGSEFAGLCQKILDDIKKPGGKTAFSVFVRNETRRNFADQGALSL